MSTILFLLIISAFMTGVIWIIQLIHYPAFGYIDQQKWAQFHEMHVRGITPVVAPLMVVELVLSFYWVYTDQDPLTITNFLLVLILWASTFLIQVPIHNKLENKQSQILINKLCQTNWVRTLTWTVKTITLFLGYTLK